MLAEGAVNQVLVLCPSNTIEAGLTEKFRLLSGDKVMKDLLPKSAAISNPRIINASQTIQKGDICIENIHATYMRTKSAIEDSLAGNGERTLVLNDEAHHMTNPSNAGLKKWKEFLLDPKYKFKYIVGLSGTCYVGNDYFADVIYRFSLRDSIENKFIKSIKYVAEDSSGSKDEKFQKIYENHIDNKKKYRKLKPLTILVTRDIAACKRLTDEFVGFIVKRENIAKETASKKVLVVTSTNEHKSNIPKLRYVDDKNDSTEWITSVSMLSEGWDVKNVFQIVPHEERAFNSKLLIAQVLGRGLRIPDEYKGEQPVVTVFNHDKWSRSIKHLVNEVLEIEKRVDSYAIPKDEDYNFKIYNIDYKKKEEVVDTPQEEEFEFLKKCYISYSTQAEEAPSTTEYETAVSGTRESREYLITYKMHPSKEVVNELVIKLRVLDMDLGTNYSREFTKERVKEIVKESLKRIGAKGDGVSDENLQKTLQAFGTAYRKRTKSLRFKIEATDLVKIDTNNIRKNSLGVGALRRGATIFFDEYSLKLGEEDDKRLLKELDEDESLPKSAMIRIENKYNFKTPLNVVLTSFEPERKFVKMLTQEQDAKVIDAWIKSLDVGFYSIEYSWRKGEHPKQGSFNPDFFIKVENDIVVVETKMDGDTSDENKAKLKYTKDHFERLNKLQKEHKYYFKFLSPESYDLFFKSLREKTYHEFKSELESKLE